MAYNTRTAMPPRSGSKRGANFRTTGGEGKSVRVSPGKGGVNLGMPSHCESKRSASNLKGIYRY